MFKVTNSKKFKQREQYFSGKDFMLRKSASITSNFIVYIMTLPKARRTLELTAELSVTRDSWRKHVPQGCGAVFSDFWHACHRSRIFNMLNNFVHERGFPPSVRAC